MMHFSFRVIVVLSLTACTAAAPDEGTAVGAHLEGRDASAGIPLRIMAANTSSGNNQSYDPGDGQRLFEGLKPDVALVQELNIGDNSTAAVRAFVDTTFGTTFSYYRENGQLPNGIISRYPIAASGSWTDPRVSNRGFAWAKIAVPGPHPLWAVSLHLLTSSSANRAAEATALVAQIKATVPAADYLVIGGDLNTGSRTEPCMATLGALVGTSAPYPDDGHGNADTSGNRSKPHDWVMVDADLAPRQVPTRIGSQSFPAGLVFDSRVYAPLSDVPPIQASDSASSNMQHMPVVKDFVLDAP